MKPWKILIFCATLYSNIALASPKLIDKIEAVVNNNIILHSDVNDTIKFLKKKNKNKLLDNAILRKQSIKHHIAEILFLEQAKYHKLTVTDKQLSDTIKKLALSYNITEKELRSKFTTKGYIDFCNKITRELLIKNATTYAISPYITILPEEINTVISQINDFNNKKIISYILVPLHKKYTKKQISNKKKLAQKLTNQLKHGYSFKKILINSKSLKHGKIDVDNTKNLPKLFVKILEQKNTNNIIGPIYSKKGFYIAKIYKTPKNNYFVDEVNIRRILLIPSKKLKGKELHAKLKKIYSQIINKKITFEDAAKQFSNDVNSANTGGNLGWAQLNSYDKKLQNVILHLKNKKISKPIKSHLGWYIIQLLDKRKVDLKDKIQKEQAYKLLYNRKFLEETEHWLQEKENASYIKIFSLNDK